MFFSTDHISERSNDFVTVQNFFHPSGSLKFHTLIRLEDLACSNDFKFIENFIGQWSENLLLLLSLRQGVKSFDSSMCIEIKCFSRSDEKKNILKD